MRTTSFSLASLASAGRRFGALAVVAALVGCGEEAKPECDTAVAGTATDEVVRVFADLREFSVDDPAAPKLSVPSAAQTFSADDAAPTFSWSDELAVVTPLVPRAPVGLPPLHAREPGWLESVSHLFIGTAYAHLPPVTGGMYLLEVPLDGEACPSRMLTSELSFTPDDTLWSQMKATGDLSLTMTSAYLVEGRVTEGPYQSTRSFSVR